MLDDENTISRLQSPAVRAALIAIVINVLTLVSAFTGLVFDIEVVKAVMENGLTMAINALSLWLALQSMKGRVNATKKIEPLPWKEEIKTLINKEQ